MGFSLGEQERGRAVIHSCTVGGHPVQPQPQHHPALHQHRHPGVPTSQDDGTPEQGQDLHVPPGLDFLIYSLEAACNEAGKVLGSPLQILWPCSSGGAWPWCQTLLQNSCSHAQTDCKAGGTAWHPQGARSQHQDALHLLCSFLQARQELDQD